MANLRSAVARCICCFSKAEFFYLSVVQHFLSKRKANAVCNTCSLQTKLELLLN